jgi:DNA polymerase elongation subunit (family B)
MFGVNEKGETCSIIAEDYRPFFYVLVNDNWTIQMKDSFLAHIKSKIGKYYEKSITECIIIKRKKLYGFDGGKDHKFIKFEFASMSAFNKVKNLWYTDYNKGHNLLENGYQFNNTNIKLYEANIPPLLRFFHIRDISPSGWIALPKRKTICLTGESKKSTSNYEYVINYKNIVPLNDKETRVPYKIMSFDIEASSSHGDFPVPIKTYKKLATNIVEYFENLKTELNTEGYKTLLRKIIMTAFGYDKMSNIDLVYPKKAPESQTKLEQMCEKWLASQVRNLAKTDDYTEANTLESLFEKMALNEENGEDDDFQYKNFVKTYTDKKATIVDILSDKKFEREGKLNELNISLNAHFPKLEGDKCTFIGSTFMNYGEQEPFKNHCIVLNTCSELPMENSIVESYNTEKEVLMAWQKLVQRENPDIIIGYNIFGFDYQFMFHRAEETGCVEEFLKLSRVKDEICASLDNETGKYKIEESSIQIASGQHDLRFIKMNGRLQVDLYNFYRREANLTSYKLDYVAGNFIGDFVKNFDRTVESGKTEIKTGNMIGLLVGSFVHFEEIGHSVDYYDDGAKFIVTYVDKPNGIFRVEGLINPDTSKKVRWCLAKDDVTPKDIFRMTNGTADDRAVIAKYCIQDCNLVHYLFNKSDILTGFIEMAKICSVPINFLVMRGQGIKLTSFVSKKCREKRTLMPVIEKGGLDEGYEGAIVLEPKCDLYLDNPVACVDYASLYPSSMISENLSHDSKVWTKEYDLHGVLIEEWGEKDPESGNYIYDNLPGYEYVSCTYDTYRYVRKTPTSAAEKVKAGHKICRFAQPEEGEAIMPSILKELLKARKDTRKMIPDEKDEFMKNVLDQRQLGYKVTANSLYGQCGAKTSTFYEKDIAACTTATGRLLLTYAKKIIEECYGDNICNTKEHGPVLTKAEYIYGDSVANYTPVYISTFEKGGAKGEINRIIDILTIEDLAVKYGCNNWVTCKEEGKQDKEFCELENVETWTEKGWTKLYRVIRHALAPHKKMFTITTHKGRVCVTDDHSLIRADGSEVSPKDIQIGTELLHNPLKCYKNNCEWLTDVQYFKPCYDRKIRWNIFIKYLTTRIPCNTKWFKLPHKINGVVSYEEFNKNCSVDLMENATGYIMVQHNETGDNNIYNYDNNYEIILTSIIEYATDEVIAEICVTCQMMGFNFEYRKTGKTKDGWDCVYLVLTQNSYSSFYSNKSNLIMDIDEEECYKGYVYDLTTDNHHFAAGIGNMIVHNTDSVFFTFNLQTPDGKPIRGKEALEITIELAQEAGHLASSFLKGPHDLEYEKTFMPFCLLSKKRYVGMLYETDPNKCKRKEMGIVLKRRDNAPIVKDIYGGIIDILMKKQNIKEATEFLKSCLQNIVDEKYPMDKLIITKSLRSGYKNPQSIAHKVLADRITARDPGNKPSSGDRIPFVYINSTNKKALQGEKIETPTYITENNLKIDYSFYITNQIMKPVQQLFALVLEKIWEMQKKLSKISKFKKDVELLRKNTDPEKFEDKLEQMRNKEVKVLLFDEYLRETNNEKQGNQSLTKFFKK